MDTYKVNKREVMFECLPQWKVKTIRYLRICLCNVMLLCLLSNVSGCSQKTSAETGKRENRISETQTIKPDEASQSKPIETDAPKTTRPKQSAIITVLDIKGNGPKVSDYKSIAFFDHDSNGFAERTGWPDPSNSALLVWDVNKSGKIDNGRKVFGTYMIIEGKPAPGGILTLKRFDKNNDNKIDKKDKIFSQLLVWHDFNGDGHSASDELFTLQEMGIKAILLAYKDIKKIDNNGNTLLRDASYEKDDGTFRKMADYEVLRDPTYTISTEWLNVPKDVASLPDIEGYGNINTLHQAMTKDPQLIQFVRMAIAEKDPATRTVIFENVLFRWAGVDRIKPDSRGNNVDARWVSFNEKAMGKEFKGINDIERNPNPAAASLLFQAYEGIFEMFYAQFLAQTHLKDIYSLVSYSYDEKTKTLKGDPYKVIEKLKSMIQENEHEGKIMLKEFARSIKGLMAEQKVGYGNIEKAFSQYGNNLPCIGKEINISCSNGNSEIQYRSSDPAVLTGSSGNNNITGWRCNDRIYGREGDDKLFGGSGDDYLDGGPGNDYLAGGWGDDTYFFGRGYGADRIYDTKGQNTVLFAKDIKPTDLKITMRHGLDLIIAFKTSFDELRIDDWKSKNGYTVQKFVFADGQVWTPEDVKKRINVIKETYERASYTGWYVFRFLLTNKTYLYLILGLLAVLAIDIAVRIIKKKKQKKNENQDSRENIKGS